MPAMALYAGDYGKQCLHLRGCMVAAMGRSKRRWQNAQAKREPGQFDAFPRACSGHPNYARLTVYAKVLLHELLSQYNGSNNGDLCCAWGVIKHQGLGCKTSTENARDELEITGWIVQTRQGWNKRPNLYALTFLDTDECGQKMDAGIPSGYRFGYWGKGENPRLSPRLAVTKRKAA